MEVDVSNVISLTLCVFGLKKRKRSREAQTLPRGELGGRKKARFHHKFPFNALLQAPLFKPPVNPS